MIIALTGFMGCGKSSVAGPLAARMGCFFFDLDDTIEMEEGRSIAEIFASEGEGGFRALELEYLERIISDYEDFPTSMVISLGGGTVTTPQCAQLIKKNCTCIYLRATVDTLVENLQITGVDGRPMMDGVDTQDEQALRSRIGVLMEKRAAIYEKTADHIIDIDGMSCEQIAEKIAELL